jgi:hypothetical protein
MIHNSSHFQNDWHVLLKEARTAQMDTILTVRISFKELPSRPLLPQKDDDDTPTRTVQSIMLDVVKRRILQLLNKTSRAFDNFVKQSKEQVDYTVDSTILFRNVSLFVTNHLQRSLAHS